MYLDHNAGGRVRPEVAEVVAQWLRTTSGNPSSLHAAGRRARTAIEEARERVAALVGARPNEVVFTSGGTEANNLAVRGFARSGAGVVTTAIEHHSVVASVERAAAEGAKARFVDPGTDGCVTARSVGEHVDEQTAIVSVGWANGEIGSVQPVAEIVREVRRICPEARVHSDAVQAASQLDVDVTDCDVDLLSLSAHKLGAPAGTGALVMRGGVDPQALLVGGPQERERRAGTENVLGIVAFGRAAELALEERAAYAARATAIREEIWQLLQDEAAPVARFGARAGSCDGLPGTLAIGFEDLRGDALAAALDLRGVAVSTGSACAAAAPEPSHVLKAIGASDALALGGLRLSIGPELTSDSARAGAMALVEVAQEARGRRSARAGAADAS